jgi:2-polyprenyl-6-methoxyphenol hydroxylase-like FAD-dependent oxidoreductase
MDSRSQPICIVGAGPAGLVCALSLAQKGMATRIFEQSAYRIGRSRATGLQENALRILDELGVGKTIRGWATPIYGSYISFNHAPVKYIPFADKEAKVVNNLSLNQSVTESVLFEALEKQAGVKFAWGKAAKLQGRTLTFDNGETMNPAYIIAADGRHSGIRQAAGIEAEETQDSEITFGCDATLQKPNALDHGCMHQMFFAEGRIVFVPLPGAGRYKISGTFSKAIARYDVPDAAQLEALIEKRSGIRVKALEDVFLYRLGSVRAQRLRAGNVILAGDAAQTFYPNGGFGLNTAIEQAAHLAEVLASGESLGAYEAKWRQEVDARMTVMNRLRSSTPV